MGVFVVEELLASEHAGHRNACGLGESPERDRILPAPARTADNHERPSCSLQPDIERTRQSAIRHRALDLDPVVRGRRAGLPEHILRQRDDRRSRTTRQRGAESVGNRTGTRSGSSTLRHGLRHAAVRTRGS